MIYARDSTGSPPIAGPTAGADSVLGGEHDIELLFRQVEPTEQVGSPVPVTDLGLPLRAGRQLPVPCLGAGSTHRDPPASARLVRWELLQRFDGRATRARSGSVHIEERGALRLVVVRVAAEPRCALPPQGPEVAVVETCGQRVSDGMSRLVDSDTAVSYQSYTARPSTSGPCPAARVLLAHEGPEPDVRILVPSLHHVALKHDVIHTITVAGRAVLQCQREGVGVAHRWLVLAWQIIGAS